MGAKEKLTGSDWADWERFNRWGRECGLAAGVTDGYVGEVLLTYW